jgi:hypothetical protein
MENLQQKYLFFIWICAEITQNLIWYYNTYPPELANRFFWYLNDSKGAKLLIDLSAALLQIIFGIILYPCTIIISSFFGMLLLMLLYFIFKFSYNPGLETSMKESNTNTRLQVGCKK